METKAKFEFKLEEEFYPYYGLKAGLCIACESKTSLLQCGKSILYLNSKRCGIHDGKSTENCDFKKLRGVLFEKVRRTEAYCLMYIEYEWVKDALLSEDIKESSKNII